MRSSQKWETWARRGFPQPQASPVGLLALEKGAVTVRCSGPSAWCCLLLPQHHPFTPDASLSRPPYTRTMEVWGDSEQLSPSPSLMGVSTQVGGGNIVLPSDLQDTASPSQKTSLYRPISKRQLSLRLNFLPSALLSLPAPVCPLILHLSGVPRLGPSPGKWLVGSCPLRSLFLWQCRHAKIGSGSDHGVGHTGGGSSQKPIFLGALVASVLGKAHGLRVRKGNYGQGRREARWSSA